MTTGQPAAGDRRRDDEANGIFRIDTPLGDRLSSLFLVVGSEGAVLFDTGVDSTIPASVVPAMHTHGIGVDQLRWAVVSHADVDHFGGVCDVHECLPAAAVIAGAADAPMIADYPRFEAERVRGFREPWGVDETAESIEWCRSVARADRVDRTVTGGEILDLGDRLVEIVSVPGHSRGHLALHDHATKSWFISDAVLGAAVPFADGRPAFPPTYRHVDDYLSTIRRVEQAEPSVVHTAHYGSLRGAELEAFLAESVAFAAELDAALVGLLAQSPTTLSQILPELNRRLATWPPDGTETALAFPVVGHLEQLAGLGRIRLTPEPGGAVITLSKE